MLVQVANQNDESRWDLLRTLDAERKQNSRVVEENQELRQELEQVKLELKLERQNKFATNQRKPTKPAESTSKATLPEPKKRGAPVGHPGWFRKTPTEYDWGIDVSAPSVCQDCQGRVTVDETLAPSEHLQEDVVDGRYRVVLYRHPAACCKD